MLVLSFEAVYLFIPSIWIVFTLVLFEGFVAGAAYVNTFYQVAREVRFLIATFFASERTFNWVKRMYLIESISCLFIELTFFLMIFPIVVTARR